MHLVRDAPRAPAVGRAASFRLAALAAIAAVVTAAVLAACGGSEDSGAADAPGTDTLGPINLADCTDWNAASEEARRASIGEIREFAGGPVAATGGGSGAVLSDDEAYQLFENTCANDYARGFKLYKLYSRGAAFGGP